jgi:hypothetical protein
MPAFRGRLSTRSMQLSKLWGSRLARSRWDNSPSAGPSAGFGATPGALTPPQGHLLPAVVLVMKYSPPSYSQEKPKWLYPTL